MSSRTAETGFGVSRRCAAINCWGEVVANGPSPVSSSYPSSPSA
ncbi:MAG TPA: hypothetical protein VJ992_11945 [Gemmatimonadales bacterium]|nr:hypothetical protein [Gemmatimonadales bacterium]